MLPEELLDAVALRHRQLLGEADYLLACLLQRCLGVGVVLVVEVDPVGPESAQTEIHALEDPSTEGAGHVGLAVGTRRVLGGEHDLVASAATRCADELLGLTVAYCSAVSMWVTRTRRRR